MSSLVIRDLCKRFGNVEVLKNVNLEAQTGEFIALVGPSGCGKSTLLAMLAGLESVSSGSIEIAGRVVNSVAPKDRDIAMVFQSYALYPTMTVRENITFGMESRGVPKPKQDAAVDRVAALLQIGELLQRKPAQLSGGQRQRVAMGRAMVRDPALFLFDEPLSNLDAKLRVEMRTEIKKLHQRVAKTTIYVTHDQVEAMTLATRVAVMRGGRIQQIGTPGEVYARPVNMFVAGFLGSPGINFIDGEAAPGRTAILGVRPEHLLLHPADGAHPEAEVTLVEAMGAHEVVWLDMQGHRLAAIAPATGVHQLGDRVGVQMDLGRAILFDPVSQERIEVAADAFQPRMR